MFVMATELPDFLEMLFDLDAFFGLLSEDPLIDGFADSAWTSCIRAGFPNTFPFCCLISSNKLNLLDVAVFSDSAVREKKDGYRWCFPLMKGERCGRTFLGEESYLLHEFDH